MGMFQQKQLEEKFQKAIKWNFRDITICQNEFVLEMRIDLNAVVTIIGCWPTHETVLGFSFNELIGLEIDIFLPEDYVAQHRKNIVKFINFGREKYLYCPKQVLLKNKSNFLEEAILYIKPRINHH